MSLNLTAYDAVQTNLFIKLVIPGYQTLTFSDYYKTYSFGGDTYSGLGELLSVSNTNSDLRAAPQELTIQISGIPAGNVSEILNNKIKGSAIKVYRGFFDATTGELLSIGNNPTGKFSGIVSNFDISDDLEGGSDTGEVILTLTCTSVVELLNNKVTGRRTNPDDQKLFFPGDTSMDRVPALAKSNFNFGAPTK